MLTFVRKLFGIDQSSLMHCPIQEDQSTSELEVLEQRCMLSGNIVATMIGADVFLWGDGNDNDVSIELVDDDVVLVGKNETTINGNAEPLTLSEDSTTFGGSILSFMYGGNDRVVVQDDVQVTQSVLIFGGQGDDSVGIGGSQIGGDLIVTDFFGNNQLALDGTIVNQNVINFAGTGNDISSILDASIRNSLLVISGGGDDAIVIESSQIQRYAGIHTGVGNDDVVVSETSFNSDFHVNTGIGNDLLQVDATIVGGVSLFLMGGGEDATLFKGGNEFRGTNIHVGGAGNDRLEVGSSSQFGNRRFSISNEADVVPDSIIEERLTSDPNGALTRSEMAQQLVGTEPSNVLLSLDLSANTVVGSNDTLITRNEIFVVAGVTSPGATIEIDSDSDGQFDDGVSTALPGGSFSINVNLQNNENNLGANRLDVRARIGSAIVIESVDVHYAIGSVARFATQFGSFYVELSADPGLETTVGNFLDYQERYENSILHRSAKTDSGGDFVIQGGGYRIDNGAIVEIATDPPIVNQFNSDNSNLRGTIAMALPSNDVDGATSQWFINMTDDNAALDDDLFTVFGRLIGTGIEVADLLHRFNTSNISASQLDPALDEVPLVNFVEFTKTISGTASIQTGQDRLIGTATSFTNELVFGSEIRLNGQTFVVASVISDTEAVLTSFGTSPIIDSDILVNGEPDIEDFVIFNSIKEVLA